jgi:hypothetical protein
LGTFAKLRQATISFTPVRPTVSMEQLGSHWTDFDEIWYLNFIQDSSKSDKNNRYFTWRLFTWMAVSRWILFRMRNISDKSCRENQNTHFILNNLCPKIVSFMITWKKYGWAREATNGKTAHALRMLNK